MLLLAPVFLYSLTLYLLKYANQEVTLTDFSYLLLILNTLLKGEVGSLVHCFSGFSPWSAGSSGMQKDMEENRHSSHGNKEQIEIETDRPRETGTGRMNEEPEQEQTLLSGCALNDPLPRRLYSEL